MRNFMDSSDMRADFNAKAQRRKGANKNPPGAGGEGFEISGGSRLRQRRRAAGFRGTADVAEVLVNSQIVFHHRRMNRAGMVLETDRGPDNRRLPPPKIRGA